MKTVIVGPRKTQIARGLRALSTPPEKILWEELRNRRLGGYKFRRQHPLFNYIIDFYCKEQKLAVEIDGSIHNLDEIKQKDQERDNRLVKNGIRIIRFTNNQIINTLDRVKKHLLDELIKLDRTRNLCHK